MAPSVPPDVRRGDARFHTELPWLESWHCYSYGRHYDPANTSFGLLLASNEDVIAGGSGFSLHPHRAVEIVTWVLSGELVHDDSTGQRGRIRPGVVQRLSTGSGIAHAEMNGSATADLHLVQMWVAADRADGEPSYEQRDVSAELLSGGLVPIAGRGAAVSLRQPAAVLYAARLAAAQPGTALPRAPFVHLFLARGRLILDGVGELAAGDAVRLVDDAGRRVSALADGAELLVWAMSAGLPSRSG